MDGQGPTWRTGRNGAIDAMRGVAVLLVMAGHALVPGFRSAHFVGVTLFFLLSGFLITTLLAEEMATSGGIALRRFYLRRGLRIVPASIVAIGAWTAYDKWAGVGFPSRDAVASLLNVANWPRLAGSDMGTLGQMWSLSFQEQFYLLWPLALLASWRIGRRWPVAIALIVGLASAIDRFWLASLLGPVPRVEFGPDTRIDALLFGSVVALSIGHLWLPRLRRWSPWIAAASLAAILLLGTDWWNSDLLFFKLGIPSAEGLGIALILAAVAGGDRLWLAQRPLIAVGRVSYGLFLWHYPIMRVVEPRLFWLGQWPAIVIAFGLSFLAAWLSWRLIEQPFMRLRSRILPRPRGAAPSDDPEPAENPAQSENPGLATS